MYDPESNLRLERSLRDLELSLNDISQEFGENDPCYLFFCAIKKMLMRAVEIHQDCQNCFDEEEKGKLQQLFGEILKDASQCLAVFQSALVAQLE